MVRRDAANVKPGDTVVVVGDGAVGLLGVLSAKQMGAERIIAMSRHDARQRLAREFGATDIVTERGDEGIARIKDLTKGIGADSAMLENIISISNLSRRFGSKAVLDDISLDVPRGSVFGLVGENGAGKTTLIKHILGLWRSASGTVRVFGTGCETC